MTTLPHYTPEMVQIVQSSPAGRKEIFRSLRFDQLPPIDALLPQELKNYSREQLKWYLEQEGVVPEMSKPRMKGQLRSIIATLKRKRAMAGLAAATATPPPQSLSSSASSLRVGSITSSQNGVSQSGGGTERGEETTGVAMTALDIVEELKEDIPLGSAPLAALHHGANRQVHLLGGENKAKRLAEERLQRNVSYTLELFGPYELFMESMKEFASERTDGEEDNDDTDEDSDNGRGDCDDAEGDLVMANAEDNDNNDKDEGGQMERGKSAINARERTVRFALIHLAREKAAEKRLVNLKEVFKKISALARDVGAVETLSNPRSSHSDPTKEREKVFFHL